jgi:hypothetical protein
MKFQRMCQRMVCCKPDTAQPEGTGCLLDQAMVDAARGSVYIALAARMSSLLALARQRFHLRFDAALFHGLLERRIVGVVLIGVTHSELD